MNNSKRKGKKQRTELVFNPEALKDFVNGFHKRKQQRKKKAKEELDRRVKNEIKRIRSQTKLDLSKKYQSFKPIKIPILDDQEEEEDDGEEVAEDDEVLVSVKTLGRDELAKKYNWIGDNRPQVEEKPESEVSSGEEEEAEMDVEGFSLSNKTKNTKISDKSEATSEEALKKLQSKKDLDKEMKKKTLKALKKSKALKSKVRIQRNKNIKKSRRTAHFKKKTQSHSKDSKKRTKR